MPKWLSYPLIDERAEPDVFAPVVAAAPAPAIDASYRTGGDVSYGYDDGEKFYGGFGPTMLLTQDYWTLRARSSQLFETNPIARGVIRRLVTNEINTGLHLEATPEEKILGYQEEELGDWSEDVENRFALWAADPWLCDHLELRTFGELQAAARTEALVAGDVLVVLRQYQPTGLPRIQLINSAAVQTPFRVPRTGNKIQHGVELDSMGRQVAYWVRQDDGSSKRIAAYGEKSGRRLAWLVYGTERRLDQVRGKPLLALLLQSLRELDRYRDAAMRKAVINSIMTLSVEREADTTPGRGIAAAGARAGVGLLNQETADAAPRQFKIMDYVPGAVVQDLGVGEKLKAHQSGGTEEALGPFEEAVLATVAWTSGIPPENLRMTFSSNYSASKAANSEFDMILTNVRTWFGINFCQPVYSEWLVAQALTGKIVARGFLDAWRSVERYDEYAAWISSDWTGQIKPSIDPVKMVNAFKLAIDEGLMTRDRAAREWNGSKYTKNVKKQRRENEALALARAPLEPAPPPPPAESKKSKPADDDEPKNDSAPDEDEDEEQKG